MKIDYYKVRDQILGFAIITTIADTNIFDQPDFDSCALDIRMTINGVEVNVQHFFDCLEHSINNHERYINQIVEDKIDSMINDLNFNVKVAELMEKVEYLLRDMGVVLTHKLKELDPERPDEEGSE